METTTRSTSRIRQRLEQNRVDDAEDGGARADAERQRQHGDDGEGCVLPQHTRRVAQSCATVSTRLTPRASRQSARICSRPPNSMCASRLASSRLQPDALVLQRLRVEMGAQFLVELGVDRAAPQQRRARNRRSLSMAPRLCWSTLATAAVIFRQAVWPAWSCRRPLRRELVILRAPVVVRGAPLRLDPAARARGGAAPGTASPAESAARRWRSAARARRSPSRAGLERERPENQQIERALRQGHPVVPSMLPLCFYNSKVPVEAQVETPADSPQAGSGRSVTGRPDAPGNAALAPPRPSPLASASRLGYA